MYSFRRTALQEMARTHGREEAAQLANHVPDGSGSSLIPYLHGQRDLDIVAARLQEPGQSKEQVAALWRQVHRLQPAAEAGDHHIDLVDRLRKSAEDYAQEDPEWHALDQSIHVSFG